MRKNATDQLTDDWAKLILYQAFVEGELEVARFRLRAGDGIIATWSWPPRQAMGRRWVAGETQRSGLNSVMNSPSGKAVSGRFWIFCFGDGHGLLRVLVAD